MKRRRLIDAGYRLSRKFLFDFVHHLEGSFWQFYKSIVICTLYHYSISCLLAEIIPRYQIVLLSISSVYSRPFLVLHWRMCSLHIKFTFHFCILTSFQSFCGMFLRSRYTKDHAHIIFYKHNPILLLIF